MHVPCCILGAIAYAWLAGGSSKEAVPAAGASQQDPEYVLDDDELLALAATQLDRE